MSRLFIIGAGFSKAIANAPVANNMLKAIWQKSLLADEEYKHRGDWPIDRSAFIKILTYFHYSIQELIHWLEENDNHKILNKNFEDFLESLNIEFVCSYLDLLSKHYFIPKVKGVDMQGCPIPYIHSFHKDELESALKFINHHMLDLLLPDNLEIDRDLFNKMADIFTDNDNFISFNYDLLIEQMLWHRKLWNPFDGYGFEFDRNGNEDVFKSKTKVIKIHGSINWRSPDRFFHPNLELAIDHPFKDKPLFEGLKIPKSIVDKTKYRPYPLYSHIILPTFMKTPQYNWEIKLIEDSIKYCQKSDEIYILGYSAPDADYVANILFSEFNKNSKIYIVLWNSSENIALNMRNKLVEKYGIRKENIIHENTKIEQWIKNEFDFSSYKKYLEDKKIMDELIKYSRHKA